MFLEPEQNPRGAVCETQILGHVPGISGEVGLLFLPGSQALLPWAWGRTLQTSAGEGVDKGSLVLNQGAKPEHFLPCLRGLLMLFFSFFFKKQ